MAPIPAQTLFTLQIPEYKSAELPSKGGTITVQRISDHATTSLLSTKKPPPKRNIYLLTFNSPADNRLTPAFNGTFLQALTILQHTQPPGLLITTSGIPKFYSNGLDFAAAKADPKFMTESLLPLWRKLITYPMPTCALVNGHAFAGGLMLAMCHDYRVMNPHKGYLCLNELEFGAELSAAMNVIFTTKVSMSTCRSLMLEARRFGALAAVEAGIVDGVGEGWEDAVKVVDDAAGVVGLVSRAGDWEGTSYGRMKERLYKDIVEVFDVSRKGVEEREENKRRDRQRRVGEEKRVVEAWRVRTKAKL